MEKKKNPLRFETFESTAQGKTKTAINEEKKKKRALQKEAKAKQQEIKKLEDDINSKEEILSGLQEDLCKEEIYSNPSESERVNKEIKNIQQVIADLYEKWEELSLEE